MTAPVKNITYLSGSYPLTATILQAVPLVIAPRVAVVMRLMPPLWRRLVYHDAQPRARTILIPRPLYLQAMIAIKMTLFWRQSSGGLPQKGQRFPLTR